MITALVTKIASLFLIMMVGALLIRLRVVSIESTKMLSVLCVYVIMPCSMLTAFEMDLTAGVIRGVALSMASAVLIHAFLMLMQPVLKNIFHFTDLERVSVMYSNAGNLVIPLVTAVFGAQYVIYTCPFLLCQQAFVWTHAYSLLSGEKKINLKKIFLNPNVICIAAGLVLFFTGLRLPAPAEDAVSSLGSMIGPLSMLMTGMIIGSMNLKTVFSNRHIYFVTLLRLIVIPLILIAVMRCVPSAAIHPEGKTILMISLLACITPSASTITQLAVLFNREPEYSSAINVLTNLLCMVTMPIMFALYSLG